MIIITPSRHWCRPSNTETESFVFYFIILQITQQAIDQCPPMIN